VWKDRDVSFLCPECSRRGSLNITLSIELPPDSRSDEITLQTVKCSDCGFEGIAVYEESRRGSLGSESFSHTGYHLSKGDLGNLRKTIKSCRHRKNWRCRCPAHRKLSRADTAGRWSALRDLETTDAFPIKI
jgi:hypothetical protein